MDTVKHILGLSRFTLFYSYIGITSFNLYFLFFQSSDSYLADWLILNQICKWENVKKSGCQILEAARF